MPPQPKETLEKGERETHTQYFQDFKGIYTKASRTAIPKDNFYDLQNLMPIGPANLHTVPGHFLNNTIGIAGKIIYWGQYFCINSTDYLLLFATSGEVYAYNIQTNGWATIGTGLGGVQARADQWKNSTVLIVDTTGYYTWDGTTFSSLSLGGILPSAPWNSPDIAVFSNHVWIYINRVLYIGAINDFTVATGFQVVNGATTQQLTDPQMRGQQVRMLSASGYLYLLFKSSIFLISDAYIPASASPPAVTFSIINVTAQIGCSNPASVFVMERTLMFANTQGLWSIDGVDATRMSSDIDGTLQYLDQTFPISGGITNVNNIQNGAFLFRTVGDPVFGTRYNVALNFDKKWWFSSTGNFYFNNTAQSIQFQMLIGGISGNNPVLFGIVNGNFLFTLFYPGTPPLSTSWQTALWSFDDLVARKGVLSAGFEVAYVTNTQAMPSFTLNVDTESRSTLIPNISTPPPVTWINSAGAPVTWQNTALVTVSWSSSGNSLYFGDGQGAFGRYVGFSGSANAGTQYEIDAFIMDYQLWNRWT